MTVPGHLVALFRDTALDMIAHEGEWPPSFYRSTQRFIDRLEGLIPARRAPHPLKAEAEREVRQSFEETVNEARTAFGLRQTWTPRLAVSWAELRTGSNGGYDRVRIAMHEYVPRAGALVDFIKYPSIAADPEIGTAKAVPWKAALRMVVAHEVAHSAAFACRSQGLRIAVRQGDSAWLKPHGRLWRHLYRHLTAERMAA